MAMRNMYEIGEVWTCGCRNMCVETDRQTDRHAHHNIPVKVYNKCRMKKRRETGQVHLETTATGISCH